MEVDFSKILCYLVNLILFWESYIFNFPASRCDSEKGHITPGQSRPHRKSSELENTWDINSMREEIFSTIPSPWAHYMRDRVCYYMVLSENPQRREGADRCILHTRCSSGEDGLTSRNCDVKWMLLLSEEDLLPGTRRKENFMGTFSKLGLHRADPWIIYN